jgi:tyrosyl-tRNA synthetase
MTPRGIDDHVALLMQGTEYGDAVLQAAMAAELKERLLLAEREGRKLRVYAGFDPRTSDLHLGHTIPMRKMRQFQELGHEVMFVVGSFTSLIGDPSDQDKLRARLTEEQVRANAATYAEQAFKILDRDGTRIEYNHTWLGQLTLQQAIPLASNFTLQQFLTREAFRKRWENDDPVYLHETFYAETTLPYLRIPGSFEYWDILDKNLSAAMSGGKGAQQALDDTAASWEQVTDRIGRDKQKADYQAAIGYQP